MKKLLIATNVLLLTIILLQAHNQIKTGDTNVELRQATPCGPEICMNYTDKDPPGLLDPATASVMSYDYANDKGKSSLIKNEAGRLTTEPDALNICFDLEKIKNFVWHIEHAKCAAGCGGNKIKFGVRIYYAKYPGKDTTVKIMGLPSSYIHKHTLFMVPVYKYITPFLTKNKIWTDFNYEGLVTPCNFTKAEVTSKIRIISLTGEDVDQGEGDNHGDLGPPPGAFILKH